MVLEKVDEFNKKVKQRGIVYISRVPPFMKPEKLRHLLGKFGAINRVYLVPEDETSRTKRKKSGGNRKVNYIEGWIEFEDKKIAKRVARLLNNTTIGGKKSDHFHDDMWNLKYLKSFQWSHLTEKIAYENRIRQQKLRLELSQSKRENAIFMERVEQSKKVAFKIKDNGNQAATTVHREFKQKEPAQGTQLTEKNTKMLVQML